MLCIQIYTETYEEFGGNGERGNRSLAEYYRASSSLLLLHLLQYMDLGVTFMECIQLHLAFISYDFKIDPYVIPLLPFSTLT